MKDPAKGLEIKDRTYHFRKYVKCFVGVDAVNWMTQVREISFSKLTSVVAGVRLDEQRRGSVHWK